MKKAIALLCAIVMLIGVCPLAAADEPDLPKQILDILSLPAWDGYVIGRVNYDVDLKEHGSYSCIYYDQYGHAAAFVLMHNEKEKVLCIFEKNSSGEWYLKAKSAGAVLQSGRIPLITSEVYNQVHVSYLDFERKVDFGLTFERRNGNWYIQYISTDNENQAGVSIYVYENKLKIKEERNGWKETTVRGVTPCLFSQFRISSFPLSVKEARESLSLPPDIPTGSMDCALPQPQSIKFSVNRKYPVYSGPGEQYVRASNGKAAMSTNDWVQVFGRCGDWLLVQYDISSSQMRIGYITASALPKKAKVDEIAFAGFPCEVITNTSLTDDPLGSQKALCSLPSGFSNATFLGCMGDDWAYIEVNDASVGQLRGFVPIDALRIDFETIQE